MSELSPLGEAACALAGLDIAVFPLQPREKKPFPETAGFKDASAHAEVTAKRWRRHPDANIGIATGARSGFWVLDIDGPEAEAAIAALEREHGALPLTVEQRTGRGRHVLFAWPDMCEPYEGVRNSASRIGPHVDVRGCGGYIVAPPSIHPSGRVYAWTDGRSPFDIPFALAPAWLWDMALPRDAVLTQSDYRPAPVARASGTSRYGQAALDNAVSTIANAAPGVQNSTCWEKSCGIGCLVAGGEIVEAQAKAALINAGLSMGAKGAPWTYKIIESIVRRAFEWARGYPRSAPEREFVPTAPKIGARASRPTGQRSITQETRGEIPHNGHAHTPSEFPPLPADLLSFIEAEGKMRKHAWGAGRMGGTFVSSAKARMRRKHQ